jgi:hypothetical protein
VLHSWELFAVLLALAWTTASPWLLGYVGGALMHMALDLAFNGEFTPRSIVAFYSFAYRAFHRFDSARLLGTEPRAVAPGFWTAFFGGATAGSNVIDSSDGHASARRRG